VPCLASDIEANLALELGPESYFPLGKIDALMEAIRLKLAAPDSAPERAARATRALDCFGWDPIVDRTIEVYEGALAAWKPGHAHRGGADLKNHLGFGGRQ
jgi:hypothetical protein